MLTATSHSYGNGQNSTPRPGKPKPLNRSGYFAELITSMRQTHNPNVVQIGHNGASGEIREILGLFFFYFHFYICFPGLAYWSDSSADFDAQWLKLRGITQRCAFFVSARWPTTFRGSNSPKTPSKWDVVRQSQPSRRKMKISTSSKLFQWNFNTLMTLPNTQRG